MSSADIPGFFYDPVKKKYFRITSGTSGSVQMTLQDANLREKQVKALSSNNDIQKENVGRRQGNKNFTRRLVLQEMGLTSPNEDLRGHYISGKMSALKPKIRLRLDIPDIHGNRETTALCTSIRVNKDDDSVYGVWTCASETAIMARIPFSDIFNRHDSDSESSPKTVIPEVLECFPPGNKIMDMDSTSNEDSYFTLCLCLKNSRRQYNSSLSMRFRNREMLPPSRSSNHTDNNPSSMIDTSMLFQFPGVYNSCSLGRSRFAVGGHKHIKVFTSTSRGRNTIFDGFMNYSSYDASSRVTCLKFVDSNNQQNSSNEIPEEAISSQLIAATTKGIIHWYDLNEQKETDQKKIMDKSISNMTQMNDNQWIISGHDDQLVMIDRRFLDREVLSFKGHVNSCDKFSVSFDSTLRVLCSSGDDCLTRIWSLDSGRLLNEIPLPRDVTPSSGHFARSSLCHRPSSTGPFNPSIVSIYGMDLIVYE